MIALAKAERRAWLANEREATKLLIVWGACMVVMIGVAIIGLVGATILGLIFNLVSLAR